jgi:hypothetical protein
MQYGVLKVKTKGHRDLVTVVWRPGLRQRRGMAHGPRTVGAGPGVWPSIPSRYTQQHRADHRDLDTQNLGHYRTLSKY